ncbi:MAG: AAC(3) family N-acetyltransferase [Anaerolineales bacterium]|nr:AAC(3) family N-acetyltransferase [Anaerolineales bacterium]
MKDITFRDLQRGLREVGLTPDSRVVVHASLSAFGHVRGGAEVLAGALTAGAGLVLMPAFTGQCQITPRVGPPANGLQYGDHQAQNAEAELFHPDLPAHADMGVTAETLRCLPEARRSSHPLLSFTAVGAGAERLLAAQTLADPWAPLDRLAAEGGDVLLLGVDHTRNAAIHLAEQRAGRKSFVRWALTAAGVRECAGWPGCSDGFNALLPHVTAFTRAARVGGGLIQRLPLADLLTTVEALLQRDPAALLCAAPACARCQSVRDHVTA